jgi:hypothetical protein
VAAPPLVVTIDIGAGDFLQLGADAGLAQIRQNPQVILAALRDAAGPDIPIVGTNYYSPSSSPGLTTPRSHTPSWMSECSSTTAWRRSTPRPAPLSPTSKPPSR